MKPVKIAFRLKKNKTQLQNEKKFHLDREQEIDYCRKLNL